MTDTENPKVVRLDPARRGEEYKIDDNSECVKIAEDVLELCKSEPVDRIIVLMERSDGSVSRRWNGMPKQALLWMLKTCEWSAMREAFGEDDDDIA